MTLQRTGSPGFQFMSQVILQNICPVLVIFILVKEFVGLLNKTNVC
jgi:hypothetical protein